MDSGWTNNPWLKRPTEGSDWRYRYRSIRVIDYQSHLCCLMACVALQVPCYYVCNRRLPISRGDIYPFNRSILLRLHPWVHFLLFQNKTLCSSFFFNLIPAVVMAIDELWLIIKTPSLARCMRCTARHWLWGGDMQAGCRGNREIFFFALPHLACSLWFICSLHVCCWVEVDMRCTEE